MLRPLVFVPLVTLMFAGAAGAESFYKWVDEKGITHYGEAPPEEQQTDLVDVTRDRARAATTPQGQKDRVVIYTKRECLECDQAKRYFESHKIPFAEYDVEESARGKEDFRRLRASHVPIILVGAQRLDEFNPTRIESLIK